MIYKTTNTKTELNKLVMSERYHCIYNGGKVVLRGSQIIEIYSRNPKIISWLIESKDK